MKHSRREIFWTFFKFGFVTFGGGWSIVAQMQKEFVEKKRWINEEELLDFTSVGRSLPGLMIGNVSVLFGYRMAGFLGAAAALGGVVLPPFLIMIGVTALYGLVKDHPLAARAMAGVRAAVVPMETKSSWLAEEGIESTEAGCASTLFSLTIEAAEYCTIIKPLFRPPSVVKNGVRPLESAALTMRAVRRSEMLASSASAMPR